MPTRDPSPSSPRLREARHQEAGLIPESLNPTGERLLQPGGGGGIVLDKARNRESQRPFLPAPAGQFETQQLSA